MKKILLFLLVIIIIVGIQYIPVERTNPPVTHNVKWDSQQTLDFAKRACFDCHSNETIWPWYSKIAPVSWFITDDVSDARKKLNFSDGNLDDAAEAADEVMQENMPLKSYIVLHPEAKFSEQEKLAFIQGLKKTFGSASLRERRKD